MKLVTYNRHGLPEWTYFDDGHATQDLYDGLGRHMATKRYTMETQVFGEHETQVPVYQSTRSYTGDGVICEDGKWRIACFAGGYFTPDPLVVKPVNPGLQKTAANVREIPDTLSTAVLAKLGGAHYYITDHQGNNVAVADSTGRVEQRTDYYPYGTPWVNSATHPFLYSGKEWLSAHGLNEYDFDARRYAPLLPRFTTLDPLCEKHTDISPYVYCSANPVNFIDPTGCDTIAIKRTDDKWSYDKPIIAKGNDVFKITVGDNTETIEFSEGEYGNRVDCINLEVGEEKESTTIGIYYVSGSGEGGVGFYVAPGGEASAEAGSNRRIPDGEYPIVAPTAGAQWQKPGVGGNVANRGIRFHYGKGDARSWTQGCFVISTDYKVSNERVRYKEQESIDASNHFDKLLGAIRTFQYTPKGAKNLRHGSEFNKAITHRLVLKSR